MAPRTPLLALAAAALLAPPAPAEEAPPDPAALLLEEGRTLAARKDAGGAYAALSRALRASANQDLKDAARDALLALPTPPAPPLTDRERSIVVALIDEERARYLRDVANRLLDRGKLRGALRLLEVVKGALAEEATAKVIGDPRGAERREREVADLRVRIFGDMPEEAKAEADALAAKCREDRERLLREAARLRKEGKPLVARRALRDLVLDPKAPEGPREAARAAVGEIEKDFLADLDPEERKATDEALGCPVFGRLRTVPSREFLFLGDEDLVARIPERSRYLLDLAYLAETDLAGRVPNPAGDRVTVFFKELWDFGGGVGGGTRIDIGRADPKGRQAVLVANGLFFHELAHCVFVPDPRFPGWMEGIANFGAAFCASFLRQETDEWHSARGNLEAFRRDFLGREEAYWRMAPYGPSAGWFLHWIDAYGKRPGGGYDWARYGRVFRAWEGIRPRPESVAGIGRTFGSLLAAEFGPRVWEDLRAQGFPVEEGTEVDPGLPDGLAHAAGAEARYRAGVEGAEAEEIARAVEVAGLLRGWRVAGPFYPPERGDGLACVFPPEREVVLGREYLGDRQVARWFGPGTGGPIAESGAGVVAARWAYPEDSVTYGLLEFEVPAAVDAWAWVGTEHRWALWVDGRLLEKQEWETLGFSPDRDRVPLRLEKGRHRLLFKAALGWIGPTFALRLTDRAGRGIPGLRVLPSEDRPFEPPHAQEWKGFFREDYGKGANLGSVWTTGPGGFQARNRELKGTESRGAVPWRKYSVRPGFPQDSPSNSLTLDPKVMGKAGKDVRVELALAGSPKVAITLDAEEEAGGLTGWTVVVVPTREACDVRLERYDRLLYLATGVPMGKGRGHVVGVERRDGFVSVDVDGNPALDRVSAPALRRDGLRICTWGAEPVIQRIEVRRAE